MDTLSGVSEYVVLDLPGQIPSAAFQAGPGQNGSLQFNIEIIPKLQSVWKLELIEAFIYRPYVDEINPALLPTFPFNTSTVRDLYFILELQGMNCLSRNILNGRQIDGAVINVFPQEWRTPLVFIQEKRAPASLDRLTIRVSRPPSSLQINPVTNQTPLFQKMTLRFKVIRHTDVPLNSRQPVARPDLRELESAQFYDARRIEVTERFTAQEYQ